MIIIDTSVWIDHFRVANPAVLKLVDASEASLHPFVLAELALGSLRGRANALAELGKLPAPPVVSNAQLLTMIEGRALHSTGLSFVDAHLVASALLDDESLLWTNDRRLERVAHHLGVSATAA
jgi:predicted nucleic acid-binding protein